MMFAGAGLALLAAGAVHGGRPGGAARAAAAAFALLTGVLLLLVRKHLASLEGALRVVADAVRAHGEDSAVPSTPLALAEAVKQRLDRYRRETVLAFDGARQKQEQRILEVGTAHKDLVTHHTVTKKMLQSRTTREVLDHLLAGIREGLGFPRTVLGVLDENGNLVFESGGGDDGRGVARIPCWEEGSLFGRTLWSGTPLALESPAGQRACREERILLGEGPSFLMPVLRKPGRKCSDVHSCGNTACPAHDEQGAMCWSMGTLAARFHEPLSATEKRKECARCEIFAPSALLVVRSHPSSRQVSRENAKGIVSLAGEAAISLELAERNEHTRLLSISDGLTGLTNHREFYRSLRRELERARRYGHSVSLLMVDADDFKAFNDRHGHLAGDLALKKIGKILRGCVRANDIVARYGGEEFGIILPEATSAGALMLAERIKTEIAGENFLRTSEEIGHLTVSIGIYSANPGEDDEERMVKFADEATYRAKDAGKNCVVVKTNA